MADRAEKGCSQVGIADLSIKVVGQAADKALLAYGIPGGGAVTEALLRQLLLVQDEQAEALARIDENVQRLIEGPWKTARLYITEATLQGLPSEEVRNKLKHAAEQLRIAIPYQEERTFAQAYVCIDLAVVLTMVRDDAATLYARKAMGAATDFLLDIRSRKRWPPKVQATINKNLLKSIPAAPIPLVFKLNVTEVDRTFNAWLSSVYDEFENIERACVALCGERDVEIGHYQQQAPRNLRYSHGGLNTNTGIAAKFNRRFTRSDEA